MGFDTPWLPVSFNYPQVLALLALGLGFFWLHRHSLRVLSAARRRLVLALRMLILALLVGALAHPVGLRDESHVAVAFLVDVSDSISPAQRDASANWLREAIDAKSSVDRYEVIAFAGEAALDQPLSTSRNYGDRRTSLPADRTDLAAALRLALTSLPGNSARRIVVLSDGGENTGDARAEARLAASAHIPVSHFSLPARKVPEALVQQILVPGRLREQDSFPIKITVDANVTARARLFVSVDGQVDSTHDVSLTPGANSFTINHDPLDKGFHAIQVRLESATDTVPENNEGAAYVTVSGAAKALIVEATPGESGYLAAALQSGGLNLEVRSPLTMPADQAGLRDFDSVILVNVRGDAISTVQQQALKAYVQAFGGGLVVVGGDQSYGAGAYTQTTLDELLPVRSELRGRQLQSSIALLLIVDRSGSMGEGPGPGATKMDLAKRASMEAVKLLGERDQVGILAFDDANTWIMLPSHLTDVEQAKQQIGTLAPGGGTAIYPALLEGYQAMAQVEAKVRHIILMTDGLAPEGDYKALTGQMRAQGITLSTIAIGTDADLGLLQRLAEMGNGRYHEATDPFDVPQLAVKETREVSRTAIVEQDVAPSADPASAALLGMDLSGMPALRGYVATTPKPASTTLLAAGEQDPLLVEWQSGLGHVVAWTSDSQNRWAANWLTWSGFAQFWSEIVKRTMSEANNSNVEPTVRLEGDFARLVVDARGDDGNYLNLLRSQATVVRPDGREQNVDLAQTAPGRYEGSFAAAQQGSYAINVVQRSGDGAFTAMQSAGVAVAYAAEYRDLAGDAELLALLAEMTGGKTLAKPADAFGPIADQEGAGQALWPWFVAWAMVLFLLDVAVRRLRVEPADLIVVLRRLPRILRERTRPAAFPTGQRLLSVKRQVAARGALARPRPGDQSATPCTASRETMPIAPDAGARSTIAERLLAAKKRANARRQ